MTDPRHATQAVTDVAIAALSASSSASAMRQVTDELLNVIGADSVLFHVFDPRGWGAIHGISPRPAWDALPIHGAPIQQLMSLHPGVELMCTKAVTEPFTLSDLVGERRWRSSEFVSMLRPVWGKTAKLHLTVPSSNYRVVGWAFTRDGNDYTPRELDIARKVQPVLDVVARQYLAAACYKPQDASVLTEREIVVLELISKGLTAEATARRLGIKTGTVNKHLENIYRKFGVSNRIGALAAAGQRGLLEPAQAIPSNELDVGTQLF